MNIDLDILNLKQIENGQYILSSAEGFYYTSAEDNKEHQFFDTKLISPDEIKRPKGDTTFFTTAGVQHIETMLHSGNLEDTAFSVYQPCIRSQYAKETTEGTSTSFINFASVIIGAQENDFINQTKNFIQLLISKGANKEQIKFVLKENLASAWGDKKFISDNLFVFVNGIEIGESIFIRNLPISDSKTVTVNEVGFGIERLNWALGKSKYYHNSFEKIYTENQNLDINKVSSLIDAIKTSTLIVSSGVLPSPHNHGYRARYLLKNFYNTNHYNINVSELVSLSYDYWKQNGASPKLQKHIVQLIIERELDRMKQVKAQKNTKNKNYDNSDIKEMLIKELQGRQL